MSHIWKHMCITISRGDNPIQALSNCIEHINYSKCQCTSVKQLKLLFLEPTITSRAYQGLMSRQDLEKLEDAFIFSWLDYSNCVFTSLSTNINQTQQQIQGSDWHQETGSHHSISLRSSHWLPVCQRIDFKILQLVHIALNPLRPKYISDLLLH